MMWTRRRWLQTGLGAGASAALGLASPGRARARSSKVLIVGDSMIATAFGRELEAGLSAAAELEVQRVGKSSTGLSRPDFFDWVARARRLHASRAPDVVVCMMGGNDAQSFLVEGKTWIKWGEPGWDDAYAARLRELRATLLPSGGVWISVGLPRMRSRKFDAKIAHVDQLVARTVTAEPGGHFIESRELLAPGDAFRETLLIDGRRRKIRADDGVHLTLHGARYLAEHVRRESLTILGLPTA